MSPITFFRALLHRRKCDRAARAFLEGVDAKAVEAACKHWPESLASSTEFYLDCFSYFHLRLPEELRAHRAYFTAKRRGFGEDAFHAMWTMLFERFAMREYLEIGVYRGQTLSLAALLQRRTGNAGTVAGISPFGAIGDSVSSYRDGIDYQADTLANFAYFRLPAPLLFKAYSTDPRAVEFIRGRAWDCIYIDGNHDYEIALADWRVCAESVKPGGVIVLDDAALTTRYDPPIFASKGHPGPSQVADEIDRSVFTEILQVGHNRVFQRRA